MASVAFLYCGNLGNTYGVVLWVRLADLSWLYIHADGRYGVDDADYWGRKPEQIDERGVPRLLSERSKWFELRTEAA